jgi:hypothetical protein
MGVGGDLRTGLRDRGPGAGDGLEPLQPEVPRRQALRGEEALDIRRIPMTASPSPSLIS